MSASWDENIDVPMDMALSLFEVGAMEIKINLVHLSIFAAAMLPLLKLWMRKRKA